MTREKLIKTTMWYHYTFIKMIKIQKKKKKNNLTTPIAGKDVEKEKLSFIAGGNAKWCSHLGEQFICLLQG